jgi:hypothetical protein
MMRNIKVLGLTAFAVLAFSAAIASAASAAEFHTASAPATLTAREEENQVFVTEAGTFSCTGVKLTATMSALSQPTVTTSGLEYAGCTTKTIFGNIELTVNFTKNSCNYRFHANGEVDLVCASGGTEGVIVSGPGCTLTVPPQTGLKSVSYTNNAAGTVTINPAVTNIKSIGSGSLCSKTGTFTNGKYAGKVLVSGNNGPISVS